MITLGYITKINNPDDNIYEVRLPIFEKAGSSKDLPDLSGSYFQATLSQTPGQLNGFLVGDCVVVGFLDNKYSKPVILGKLFVGDDGARGYLNVNALNVSGSVSLSGDIHIGDITYDQLLELVRGVPNLQEQVDKLLAGGSGEPDNYLVSASVSGNNLTLTPNTGNPIVYSPTTSVNWGDIQGTLSNQIDLQSALDSKLELYEIQSSDIESTTSEGVVTFTEDFTNKIISCKYIFKVNHSLFNPGTPGEYIYYLKPTFVSDMNGFLPEGVDEIYQYEAIANSFEFGLFTYTFAYNETTERCYANSNSFGSAIIPLYLQAGTSNSIEFNSGDIGYGGVYLKTINGEDTVGEGNIETPNDYHEPRFSSGLSIASSSNVSEIYVPYATSSTYGVIQDLYSNYVPYSGATKAVDLGNKKLTTGMLHATSFVDFDKAINLGLSSSSAHILFYTGDGSNQHYTTLGPNSTTLSTASIILPSQSGVLALQSELPTVYNAGLTIQLNSSTIGTFTANASNNSIINIDLTNYTTSSFIAENYVPYSGASKDVNLGTNSFYAENIYGNNIGILLAGENFQGFNFYDGDVNLYTGGGPLNIYTNSGGVYYDGNEVATVDQIPSVYNATLTLQKNGTDIGTFTANQSISSTIDITVPTKATDLTNDAGYLTSTSNTITSLNTRLSSAEGNIIGLGYSVVSLYSDIAALTSSLYSYATQSWVLDKRYVAFDSSTSDVNIGNGTLYAGGVNLYSQFFLTPDENGTYLTTTYGNTYIDNNVGDINLRTSSGKVYYNGSEITTKNYVDSGVQYAIGYTLSAMSATLNSYATQNWVSTNSFASFHASSLYLSTIIISNRTLNGVYTKAEALSILNGTSSVS